jgi:glycosyltransferase involved in cell wall biosynthesis
LGELVSVIIPTYNGQRFIAETLESVLAQTHALLEIIVVDDGSSDKTGTIVSGFAPRVRLLKQAHLGHPAARNCGLLAATGDYVSFIDHDDLWTRDKIASQLDCFAGDPTLDLVFGHIQNFLTPGLSDADRRNIVSPLLPIPGLLQGAMLARRASFDRVGRFSEKRSMGDFLEWYGRALSLDLRIHIQASVVLSRRIHATNFQRTHGPLRAQYLPVVKQLLDRRRGASAGVTE